MDVHAKHAQGRAGGIPVCYEKWSESEQVNKALEKARKEADQMIEKAKSAPRPEPEKETRRETEPEAA